MRRARAVTGGALLVAAAVVACATGATPTDVGGDTDSGYLDVSRREVTPVFPGDDGPVSAPPPPPGDDGSTDGPGDDGGCTAKVVVNELQSGGAGASDEFIELYNTGSCAVALAGYSLHHLPASGGGTNTLVHSFSASESISAGGYFLLTTPQYTLATGTAGQASYTSTLAASGGEVGLLDGAMKIVDAVGYGPAMGMYVEGTACSAPPASQSAARTPNGTDTEDNAKDFAIATTPTPGKAN
jgi:hypothetical protein